MRLIFASNSLVFGCTNCEIVPRTVSVKLAGREHPKCISISQQTASFLDTYILTLCPATFFCKPCR